MMGEEEEEKKILSFCLLKCETQVYIIELQRGSESASRSISAKSLKFRKKNMKARVY